MPADTTTPPGSGLGLTAEPPGRTTSVPPLWIVVALAMPGVPATSLAETTS